MRAAQSTSLCVLAALLPNTQACLDDLQPGLTARDIENQAYARRTPLASTKTAIQNVHVFNGLGFTGPQSVVFADGFITADTTGVKTVVDGTGQFLIPGLIDAHVHVTSLTALVNITSYGVTTALNMACRDYAACAALKNNGQADVATYLTASVQAIGNGSNNGVLQPPPDQLIYPNTNIPQVVAWAFGNGSDYYKIVAKIGSLTQQQQNTAVSATHNNKAQAMTHATDLFSYNQAVTSDSDGLQHVPDDGLLSPLTLAAMKKNNQFATPTMTVFKYGFDNPQVLPYLGRGNSTNSTYANVQENVRRIHLAGIPILAGTDAVGPVAPGIDLPFGSTLHGELQKLNSVGLTPLEALRAATIVSATSHRLTDRGEISNGKRADLVLLNSNPLLNIANTLDLARVWVGGVEVQDVAKLT